MVSARLPISALLSQALVAFTIELDNQFEHQMPHRTTRHSSAGGPWLVSSVMWWNCMRFVGEEGISVADLESLARTKTNLNGMHRWGYIVIEDHPTSKHWIRATAKGRLAREVWRPLFETIENRWQARFGEEAIDHLRQLLSELASQLDSNLPDCLPILGYGLFSRPLIPKHQTPAKQEATQALPALLSRVLLAFAIDFERESDLSLAICEDVVRILNQEGLRVRELPLLTGVSKEAISTALGYLQKKRLVVIEPDPTAKAAKLARLTPEGRQAQDAYQSLLGAIEKRWQRSFGEDAIGRLRESLERVIGERLFLGLKPHPDGWRASVRKPVTLPRYPMVLHRGGYPDGS